VNSSVLIIVQRADDARFRHPYQHAFGQSRDRRYAQLVPGEAFLAAEAAGLEDCDNSFLSLLGDYGHLDAAGPDVKNKVRGIALGIGNLISRIFQFRLSPRYPGEDGFRT
jgi:hypothetical protein